MQNLIKDPWIPVQLKNNQQQLIAPWQITHPDIIAIRSPRADFDAALIQFLIGLLQTTCAPKDKDQWADWLEEPPTETTLKALFEKQSHAFNIKGDSPCFMQDFEPLEVKSNNLIADLLIDSPGGNTLKENKDHFVKRGQINALCPACATTALFTLQLNAPSGGQGHRTSLRGGGPLTTLVVNDVSNSGLDDSFWVNLWLNVMDQKAARNLTGNFEKTAESDIFPWLGKTKTSKIKEVGTYPEDAHPYQMYWAMPRRICLNWDNLKAGCCDLCQAETDTLVTHYQTKNYGINYSGQWQHPLSPYLINSKTGERSPQHIQPGGINYRHWLGLIKKQETIIPALVVERYQSLINEYDPIDKEQLRIHAFGYDMDNMKARCWYESTFPLYVLENSNGVDLSLNINTLTSSAMEAASMVRSCIKEAWFKRPKDAKGDITFLSHIFYQKTEQVFYQAVEALRIAQDTQPIFNKWHQTLLKNAFVLFNEWVDVSDFGQADTKRIAKAHSKLKKLLYSPKLTKALNISKPKKEKAA